jgi:chromosome segregation ATPase
MRNELTARVQASKAALDKAMQDQKALADSLQEIRLRISALDTEIQSLTTKLASFDARSRIELQIAVLEARLIEADYDPKPLESKGYEESVLKALVLETESRVKVVQVDLLKAVSGRLVVYAKRFGMDNLSVAELKGI